MNNIRYGYIGLGHLGAKLADSLLREGFALTVHDLNKDRPRRCWRGRDLGRYPEGAGRRVRCGDHLPAIAGGVGEVYAAPTAFLPAWTRRLLDRDEYTRPR